MQEKYIENPDKYPEEDFDPEKELLKIKKIQDIDEKQKVLLKYKELLKEQRLGFSRLQKDIYSLFVKNESGDQVIREKSYTLINNYKVKYHFTKEIKERLEKIIIKIIERKNSITNILKENNNKPDAIWEKFFKTIPKENIEMKTDFFQ